MSDGYDEKYGDTETGGWVGGLCIVVAIIVIAIAVWFA